MTEKPQTVEERARVLAGQLSTLPQLAAQETPAWGDVSVPIILAALREYGDQRAREEREDCCTAIRAACGMCEGSGYADGSGDSECEYCGRPIAAIRAQPAPASKGEE